VNAAARAVRALCGVVLLAGCALRDGDAAASAHVDTVWVDPPAPPAASDTAAMLAWIDAQVREAERARDTWTARTVVLDSVAGARRTVTAWFRDTVPMRLELRTEARDAAGRASELRDVAWLQLGAPAVHVTLTTERPDRATRTERVTFMDGRVYRWYDADGRLLSRGATSTAREADALRARLVAALDTIRAARRPPATAPR
jgi:hypothetical protein